MKKLKLLAFYVIASAAFLSGCKNDDYVGKVGVCPLVVSTIPLDNAEKVLLNQVISATFNEEMDPATINQSSCVLQGIPVSLDGLNSQMQPTTIAGTINYSGKTITFTPSGLLLLNTAYTFTIKTSVKDLMGNSLQQNYQWTFNTKLSPSVISTSPATEASDVHLNQVITATFSVPMDSESISALTYTVLQGTIPVEGTVSYQESVASFTPTNDLLPNTIYTGIITTGAKNVDGIALLSNYIWTFTTSLSPTVKVVSPAENSIGILPDASITASFSMPMDPTTLTSTSVTLQHGTETVAGDISYNGLTVTFNPTSNLLLNTVYTVTITTETKSESGASLENNFVWTFTTAVAPTVISTFPEDNATDVSLDVIVTATFSVPMNPQTFSPVTFTLKQGTSITGAVIYSGTMASFDAPNYLLPNTTYTATITTEVKNLLGVPMENNYVWSFTTGAGVVAAP